MSRNDRRRWDARYREGAHLEREPDPVVEEALSFAPPSGRALDVACGRGRHALLLAARGYSVTALDVSPVALEEARARGAGLSVTFLEQDLDGYQPEKGAYALVVCVLFTDPALCGKLPGALVPGGVLAYATHPRARCRFGPAPGAVAGWFSSLETLSLREDGERVAYVGRRR